MKRIFSILSAGILALFAYSCTEETAVFDTDNVGAPKVGTYTFEPGDEAIVVTYTPADYKLDFNTKMPVNHTIAIVKVGDEKVSETVSSSVKDGVITLKVNTLNKALVALGKNMGDIVDLDMVVRATVQDLSKDNGLNGFVDSEVFTIKGYEIKDYVKPSGGDNPYADFTETSVWSVIGSIASTGNGWNQDEPMTTDGTWHLCRNIYLGPDDQFKFRKDADWGTNYGAEGDVEPFIVELDTEYPAAAGGKNLGVAEAGYYDLLLNPDDELFKVVTAVAGSEDEFMPDIDPDEYEVIDPSQAGADTWGIIGPAVSDWNTDVDLEMISDDPEIWAAKAVPFNADSFKFRGNDTWGDYDLGGGTFALDEPIVMTKGGGDMTAVTGVYDVWLYPVVGVAYIRETSDPNPPTPPTPVEPDVDGVWSLVGTINGWDPTSTEFLSVDYGAWKLVQDVKIGFYEDTESGETKPDEVKWVMDASWDVNFGLAGEFEGLDTEMAAKFNGSNIVIGEEGSYDFYLDPVNKLIKVTKHTDEPLPPAEVVKFYIDNQTGLENLRVWAWDALASIMAGSTWPTDGYLLSEKETVDSKDWYVFSVAADLVKGKDCGFLLVNEDGSWQSADCKFTADAEKEEYFFIAHEGETKLAEIEIVGQEPPADVWTVTGAIASAGLDWNGDIDMTAEGDWFIAKDVVLTTSDTFKFRKNKAWAVNVGAPAEITEEPYVITLDQEYDGSQDGKNLAVPADGTYDLYLNPETFVFKVVSVGEPVPPTPSVVKFYIENQTGKTDLLLWSWEALGFLLSGDTWPTSGYALTEKETVDEKEYLVFSADADQVRGKACGFLLVTADGSWQSNDCTFTVATDAEACYFIAKDDKTIEIVSGVADVADVWTVTGAIASAGLNWNGDIDMTAEGDWFIAKGVVLTTSDQFKFRQNKAWTVNVGAPAEITAEPYVVTLGEEFQGSQGGKNLAVPTDGTYDLYLNPETFVFKVVSSASDAATKAIRKLIRR